jgi:tripartite-type tricarboxylate transporter receptor subunit TctC
MPTEPALRSHDCSFRLAAWAPWQGRICRAGTATMRLCFSLSLTAVFVAFGFGFSTDVTAQEYPALPIRIVCGYPPGSPPDITARVIGFRMSQILGQQFIIENRTGAGSNLAAAMVARAPKDGYTLFIGSSANAINAAMNSYVPFDFVKDFAPITLLASTPSVLAVRPSLGVRSVRELIDLARAKPGTLSFGSSGVGSSTHLSLELFKSLAKVDIVHVPYAGSPQAVVDLLAGRIDGMFSPSATVMPLAKEGHLVALASTESERSDAAPGLPTVAEAGVPKFEAVLWFGLMAPTGTPPNVLAKLSRAANEAIKSDEVIETLRARDVQLVGGTPEQFSRYIGQEMERWSIVVAEAGLRK